MATSPTSGCSRGPDRTQVRRHPGTRGPLTASPRKCKRVKSVAAGDGAGPHRGTVLCCSASPAVGPEPGQGWHAGCGCVPPPPPSLLQVTGHCWGPGAGGVGQRGESVGGPWCGCPGAPATGIDASLCMKWGKWTPPPILWVLSQHWGSWRKGRVCLPVDTW